MKILLMGKRNFLLDTVQKQFHSQYGIVDLRKIKKYGQKVKSSLGCEFVAVKPTIIDLLRKCKRLPQIITPKDAAQIMAATGASNGWKCLDAGAGSGFLAIFLGNAVSPDGRVTTYEINKEYAGAVKKNVRFCGLENVIKVKNRDILKGFTEKNPDLITLDMKYAEHLIKKAHKALKHGGWLCVYSPHVEQQAKAQKEISKLDFVSVKTTETIQREWTTDYGFSHPRYKGLMHTGFITFARKS
ncbi:MAG: hypothetical protein A3D92_01315 [Bacteroidetes bacterium RIFCSPHIGHO2_02_FULL_44_7]|nr:MAG: hypothetical protein A3D92_01315 [Bacteroidetes bacterium RIFCSPHIGHO2_02_FULL_44_7]